MPEFVSVKLLVNANIIIIIKLINIETVLLLIKTDIKVDKNAHAMINNT